MMNTKKSSQGNSPDMLVEAARIPHRRSERTTDPGIRTVVSSLLRLNIVVSLACEGHPGDRHYSSTPWVDLKHSPNARRGVERKILQLLDLFYHKHRPAVSHARLCLRPTLRLESFGSDVANDDETATHERLTRRDAYLLEMNAFGAFLASLPETDA